MKHHDRTHFFKYVTLDGLRHITSSLSRQWSSPLAFNDPFDTQFDLGFPFTFESFSEAFHNALEEMVFGEKEPQGTAQDPLLKQMFNDIMIARGNRTKRTRDELHALFQPFVSDTITTLKRRQALAPQFWADFRNNLRILCLTEDHANLLMWAHYADHHKGAVIRLGCVRARESLLRAAQPVNYTDQAPYFATLDEFICYLTGQKEIDFDSRSDLHFLKLVTTKSTHWAYEKEWRVINFKRPGDKGLLRHDTFCPEEIEAIYFGCRVDDSEVLDIRKAMHPALNHVELFRAKKRQWEFALDFERMN
jgi:hypothetical protein